MAQPDDILNSARRLYSLSDIGHTIDNATLRRDPRGCAAVDF